MRKILFLFVAAVATVVSASNAHAIVITRTAGNDTGLSAFTLNSLTINNGAKTIAIDLDILKGGSLFSLGFTAAGLGANEFGVYAVTVTMKNAVTPINFAMNGFDVDISQPGGDPIMGISGSPTSNVFAVTSPNLPSGFRFGGLNGGGPAIYNGQSAISTFDLGYFDPGGASTKAFNLTFVANPEPATLLLGSLALIPAGMVARRRRKAAQEVVEAV